MSPFMGYLHSERVYSRAFSVLLSLVFAVIALPHACAQVQVNTGNLGNATLGATASTTTGAKIHFFVFDTEKKPLPHQSLVKLTSKDNGRVFFQTTNNSEAIINNVPASTYLIQVGSAGYFGWRSELALTDVGYEATVNVTLTRDPAAVDFKLTDASKLPGKARKQAESGVQDLQLGNLLQARKHLESANHAFATSSSINFLLAYVALQQKDLDRELSYLDTAVKLDPRNLQAQNLLGQLYFQRSDYAHAVESEEIVVTGSAESVVARKVLAESYLKLHEYEKARSHAQWMVDHSGGEGSSSRLILGQALAGLQRDDEAIQVLNAYLDSDPNSAVASQVRDLISSVREHKATVGNGKSISDPELAELAPSSKIGMPADVDEARPAVDASVECPANLSDRVSAPSLELVENVARFTAVEHMVHESLTSEGAPRSRETRDFNYAVDISDSKEAGLHVEEFRDAEKSSMPDKIVTTGLPVLAIAFHPVFRDDFELKCEGLGQWEGRPAWLVHFRQRDDRPVRLRSYLVNKVPYAVRLKGRAWVLTDSFHVVHMETDLVRAIPEIGLGTEHTSVTYGPVEFKRSNSDLWLPKSADLYVQLGKLRFHRSESFDHFMLFGTDVQEKRSAPKEQTSNAKPGTGVAP